MLDKKNLLALAVAAMLAACGGGESTSSSPEAAAAAMRAHVLSASPARAVAAAAVAPDEAAKQLMDYAESVAGFKVYFPEHQSTLSFGPFKYRAYSSGVLLGVVVSADPNYILNGVYVMGGAFGNNPLYVGQLTTFITPVDPNPGPGPGPTGGNNGCYDLSQLDNAGTRTVVTYQVSGVDAGTQTLDMLVGNLSPFEGQQAREVTTKITNTGKFEGQTGTFEAEAKTYLLRTGDTAVTNYGSTAVTQTSLGGFAITMNTKIVHTPPWVDRTAALALGESTTVTETSVTTSTTTGIPGVPATPTTTTDTSTTTTKYVRRESVTVPAGTYDSCVFEISSSGSAVTTSWSIVGKGIMVQSVSGSGATQVTSKATEVRFNGQKI